MRKIRTVLGLSLFLFGNSAIANIITYTVDNIGGNTWQYNYTVTNELAFDIEEFTVYFDLGLYENLAVTGSAVDWDPLVIQPDPLLPDDGFFDALALVAGIAPGDSLGGFSVSFDFLGVGTPGDQFFDIVDPFTFDSLASGITELRDADVSVPEPTSTSLIALGLFLIAFYSKRRRLSLKQSQH